MPRHPALSLLATYLALVHNFQVVRLTDGVLPLGVPLSDVTSRHSPHFVVVVVATRVHVVVASLEFDDESAGMVGGGLDVTIDKEGADLRDLL